jgi:3-deoxy-D-manno-octulosonate 8-phosphate phosphatase (KDO 8-P phosphatase)
MKKAEIIKKARRISVIVSDVDGVLTDGGIYYGSRTLELKRFHVHDGLAVKLARQAGIKVLFLSSRRSAALTRRSRELGVDRLWQGVVDKTEIFNIIKKKYNLGMADMCCLGDDLPDLPLMVHAGFPVAVANACEEVRKAAVYVTREEGGSGAFREVVEMILKAKGMWNELYRQFNK